MITPRILAIGTFKPKNLHITTAPSNRKIDPPTEAQLEAAWQAMVEQAHKEGRNLYNGVSYRLNSFQHHKDTLSLELATFEYKVRDGLLRVPSYFNLDEDYYRKGCYTTATVKTADNKYLMVRLSGKSMNTNTIDTIGGIVDAEPQITSGEGIFESFYQELREEALVTKQDIDECYLKALVLERQTNVGFYFEVKLKITAQEILARQQTGNLDQDIHSVEVFTRAEYSANLERQSKNKQLIARFVAL